MLATIDYTAIIVAAIGAAASIVAAFFASRVHVAVKTPSGDRLGAVAERTHDLAAVGVAALTNSRRPPLAKAEQRLNEDPNSPIGIPDEQGGERSDHEQHNA